MECTPRFEIKKEKFRIDLKWTKCFNIVAYKTETKMN